MVHVSHEPRPGPHHEPEARRWQDWANMAFGILLAASPWLLGFTEYDGAMIAHLGIGVCIVAVASLEIWQGGRQD